jgi:ribosomal protein S18 acetylase RimI-like enzyme
MQPETTVAICKNLADALINDHFYAVITIDYQNDPLERHARLAEYFRCSIAEGQRLGVCILPEHGLGASVWLKPQPEAIAAKAYTDKLAILSNVLGKQGFDHYQRIQQFMTPHIEAAVDKNAWYLSILGVSPQSQSKGLGRALVEPVLIDSDHEKATAYLETFNQRALPFYNRLGFLEVSAHLEPITGETYWILVRSPQPISK